MAKLIASSSYTIIDVADGDNYNENLYALSKNLGIITTGISDLKLDVTSGTISFKTTTLDARIGEVVSHPGTYGSVRGIKIPVIDGMSILVNITNPLFTKNYITYFDSNSNTIKSFSSHSTNKFSLSPSQLSGASFVTLRYGLGNSNVPIGTSIETKVKVEYGTIHTPWSPAYADLIGPQGPKGLDGQTTYTWIKYADTDTGVGMSDSPSGKKYIGMAFNKTTQTESTTASQYTWSLMPQNIEVGGRNLIGFFNTEAKTWLNRDGSTITFVTGFLSDYIDVDGAQFITATQKHLNLVTVCGIGFYDENKTFVQRVDTNKKYLTLEIPSNVKYVRYTGKSPYGTYDEGIKLEKGNVATDWTPAPEDIQADIDSKADQALTQQQLNMLIEKAQLMQTELKARVAMETLSDLERAYKEYVEANDKAVAKSQADLIEAGRRVDAMVETLGGLSKTKTFIDTYIKEAEEGIIIGTNDNVSQIRVTHNRIAMYSSGKEVMYISQGVIHIDNGVFTKTLQIGRFRTEQHQTNLDINVCRYVG